jgi:threonine synthase
MRSTLEKSGYLLDPHTAVGVSVAVPHTGIDSPVVTLGTAHPAKFPAAVKAATGIEAGLPLWLADLHQRPERFDVLANDQAAVETYVLERTRA